MVLKTKRKGFTLIELVVVIAILGILAAVLIPKFVGFQDKAHKTQILTDSKQIATAIDSLLAESSNNELTAADSADADDEVVKLAGVDTTKNSFSLSYEKSGAFKLKETLGGKDYIATSTARNLGVAVTVDVTVTP